MRSEISQTRIIAQKGLIPPAVMMDELPVSPAAANTIIQARQQISDIIYGRDSRLLVLVGPCSIHDVDAAREYAEKLLTAQAQYREQLLLVMRVYFEKPRTSVGWKGLINDPDLDGSFNINKGLRLARQLLLDISERGLPCGTEFLDVISPQYIDDLVSWGAIGARTTESQLHRELASGLSCPVGFKNGTNGDTQIAIDAIKAARSSHHFLSIMDQGGSAIYTTAGNADTHMILRGSHSQPNYDRASICNVTRQLAQADLPAKVMVDCSHGNSGKDHLKQPQVVASVVAQLGAGAQDIMGVMLESHLKSGKQAIHDGTLEFGKSITDACISWEMTLPILTQLAEAASQRQRS